MSLHWQLTMLCDGQLHCQISMKLIWRTAACNIPKIPTYLASKKNKIKPMGTDIVIGLNVQHVLEIEIYFTQMSFPGEFQHQTALLPAGAGT